MKASADGMWMGNCGTLHIWWTIYLGVFLSLRLQWIVRIDTGRGGLTGPSPFMDALSGRNPQSSQWDRGVGLLNEPAVHFMCPVDSAEG
jgi:hypothetical protein